MTAWLLPLLPAAGAVAVAGVRRKPRGILVVAAVTLLVTVAVASWAAAMEPGGGWRWSDTFALRLAVEGFGRVMVVLVPAVALPVVAYAAVTEHDRASRLVALMLAFVGAMLLLVTAADFLTLLIGWELVGVLSWALIGHGWRDPATPPAAAQAFVTTRFGDLGLYLAAGLLFAGTGGVGFADLESLERPALDGVAAGVLLAASAKSAQVPFAPWLFAAMAGPTPVSALLHSATLVAAGAYLLIRVAPVLAPVGWFLPAVAAVGLATALLGGVVAAIQPQAKRVLAASTSAQYGLMFVAVAASSTAAAGAHLVTHAAFKSLLFLGAGVAIHAVNSGRLGDMRLGGMLPRTAWLSAVGALALAAVPPLGGAWSKEQILAAALHTSGWLGAGVFAAALLSAFYAARYQLLVFGSRHASPALEGASVLRPESGAVAGMAVLAAASVGLGLLWVPDAAPLVEGATAGTLAEGELWEQAASLALVVLAAGGAWFLARRGQLENLGTPAVVSGTAADWLGLTAAARLLVIRPVVSLSGFLARVDQRVVDAGVRAAAALAAWLSRVLSRWGEWTFDGAVRGVVAVAATGARVLSRRAEILADGAVRAVAAATDRAGVGSRVADERAIDRAVEDTVRAVALAGEHSRRLQTGLAHQYYVIVAVGLAVAVAVLALVR